MRAIALILLCGLNSAPGLAAELTAAERCTQQYADDPVAQLLCVRRSTGAPQGAETQPSLPPPVLTPPLTNMQVIFNFYDRRFPGFNGGREHLGVDLSATPGTTVYAVCDGVVVSTNAGFADLVSAVVVVEHECDEPLGKVYAYYGHVNSVLLQSESVTAGGVIGTVRDWGWNSHLHYGLSMQLMENWGLVPSGPSLQSLQEQGWLNPMNYFVANSVRPPVQPVFRPVYKPVIRPLVKSVKSVPLRRPAVTRNMRPNEQGPIAKGAGKAKNGK